MIRIDSHKFKLSTGRIINGYKNIIGICTFEDSDTGKYTIYYGKDGIVDADYLDEIKRLSIEERKEIAIFMIKKWEEYLKEIN